MIVETDAPTETSGSTWQAGLLLLLALLVGAVLWIRDSVAGYVGEGVDWTCECFLGDISAATVSRSEYATACPSWELPRPPISVSNREHLQTLLPTGKSYEVMIRGGMTSRLSDRDFGTPRQNYLAYVFEVRYRRDIESNDGQRIVERRTFLEAREAKLLTPVGEMTLKPGASAASQLDAIAFPGPGEGMNVGSVREVAEAILATGAEAVTDCPLSRAFLEQDLLSGKSVRLTFVDGVGIASVEPLGWTLPKPQARYLFSQPVLPAELLPDQEANAATGSPRHRSLLAGFLNPSNPVAGEGDFFVTALVGGASPPGLYQISFLERPSPPKHDAELRPCQRAAVDPGGTLLYDPQAEIITQAELRLSLGDMERSGFSLLFEGPFQGSPVVIVLYSCRAM